MHLAQQERLPFPLLHARALHLQPPAARTELENSPPRLKSTANPSTVLQSTAPEPHSSTKLASQAIPNSNRATLDGNRKFSPPPVHSPPRTPPQRRAPISGHPRRRHAPRRAPPHPREAPKPSRALSRPSPPARDTAGASRSAAHRRRAAPLLLRPRDLPQTTRGEPLNVSPNFPRPPPPFPRRKLFAGEARSSPRFYFSSRVPCVKCKDLFVRF